MFTSSIFGKALIAPNFVVVSAATLFEKIPISFNWLSFFRFTSSRDNLYKKAPINESPAPVVSIHSTLNPSTLIYFSFEYSYFVVGISGIVLSLIGQIGDFSASCIKRYVDIKDYSNLLPGHGGMLDRFDSVIFIIPFAYAAILIFIL